MFAEVKSLLPVSGDGYDAQICLQIMAAVNDLTKTAEIALPGTVNVQWNAATGTVTDNSNVTDAYVITAIATWCAMKIGNPPNHDNLLKAYESMKGSMRISGEYTDYPGWGEDGWRY